MDAIDSQLITLDSVGRLRRLNKEAVKHVGGTFADWIGRPFSDLSSFQPWGSLQAAVASIISSGGPLTTQVLDAATGHAWEISCTSYPQTDGENAAILVARDVSDVIRLQQAMRQSETMAAMGSLVVGVAHEVRSPLFGISSILDAWTLRGDKADAEKYRVALRREVNRLSKLATELLEYGRPWERTLSHSDLVSLVNQSVAACAVSAEAKLVTIRINLPPIGLLIDFERITRVFINLVENAVQHCPVGGEVTIMGHEIRRSGRSGVEVTVADNGPGFSANILPCLFRPFSSGRPGGTGLGLAIVRRIIEEHEGTIEASNAGSGGAMVRFWLPSPARENREQ